MQNLQGLIALRVILGLVESGFFRRCHLCLSFYKGPSNSDSAGVLFLISSWYRKNELSKRTALLYCAAILSGAFGGLLVCLLKEPCNAFSFQLNVDLPGRCYHRRPGGNPRYPRLAMALYRTLSNIALRLQLMKETD